MLHKLPRNVLILVIVSGAVVGLTRAFFSDTEIATGNNFQAGKLDLKINGQDNPQNLISFGDLKPGDEKNFNMTLLADNNPAWVWLHIKDLEATQGAQTEPENVEEALNGAKFNIQDYLTYDLKVGDNVIIPTSAGVLLPDAYSCWIPLGQIAGASDVGMQQSFHFDPTVTSWAQGDVLSFTEEFYATQVRNNPNPNPPDSGTGRVWNPNSKKCVDSTGAKLVDTVQVTATSAGPTLSSAVLLTGKNYRLDVSGTYAYWPSCPAEGITPPCMADAEFALRPTSSYGPGWIKGESVYPPAVNFALDLMVNGNDIDWGAFSAANLYSTTLPGTGTNFSFSIFDDNYGDNSGGLTVKIYELP